MIKEGVININKPADWTSQDVCAKLRGRLHIKRIGHTGTLDPMATGVLPVCIGNATRIIEYYDMDRKSYHATMQLGIETDTLDITGETLKTADFSHVTEEMIRKAFSDYTGVIRQIPPKYSALKINGKRAYELAREGKEVDIKPREITIYSNNVTKISLDSKDKEDGENSANDSNSGNSSNNSNSGNGVIEFDVSCSKGTYIRSMIDDIGHALGCGATMTALVRTGSGMFSIDDAVELADLIEMTDEEIESLIIPMEETIPNLGKIVVADLKIVPVTHGNEIGSAYYEITEASKCDFYKIYGSKFIGIGVIMNGNLKMRKVITEQL